MRFINILSPIYQLKYKRQNYINSLIELYTYRYIQFYLLNCSGNLVHPVAIYKHLKLYIYIHMRFINTTLSPIYQLKYKRQNYIYSLIELYTYRYIQFYLLNCSGNLVHAVAIYKHLKLYIYIYMRFINTLSPIYQLKYKRQNYICSLIELYTYRYICFTF